MKSNKISASNVAKMYHDIIQVKTGSRSLPKGVETAVFAGRWAAEILGIDAPTSKGGCARIIRENYQELRDKIGYPNQSPEQKSIRKARKAAKILAKQIEQIEGTNPISNDFLRTYEWRKLRMEALRLHGARCQCCGASPATGAVMNVDHIKPRRTHPHLALDINNLQILCHECNHGKGNWDTTDWRTVASSDDQKH